MRTKILLALAAVLVASGMAGAQYTGALTLANISISPSPVIAGGNATITFRLYNSYGMFLDNVNLQPVGSYPIVNVSPAGGRVVGTLNGGISGNYFTYTFAIPNTTPSGTYTVDFDATYLAFGASASVATSTMPVSFYVRNRPVINAVAVDPQPSVLYSGHNQTIQIAIENAGYGTARNVTVSVAAGQGLSILSSVSTFFISNLTMGSVVDEPLLVAAKGLGSGSMVVSASYYSSNFGQRFSGLRVVNLSVAPSAQFNYTYLGDNLGIGSSDVPVGFRITNTGTTMAQELQLSLQTSYPVTPVATTAYVGSLAAGASANVIFMVSVDSAGVNGNYPVTIYEQWKQANGAADQQFTASSNFFVTVGGQPNILTLVVEAAIAVAVLAVLAYKMAPRLMKKQAKKKQ